MRIRIIAAALPLVVGLACSTSSSEGQRTARRAPTTPDTGAPAPGPASGRAPGGDLSGDDAAARGDASAAGATGRMVAGKIAAVDTQSLAIDTPEGNRATLQLGPQTTFQVDGRQAQRTDLQEGQPVRASFDAVGGQGMVARVVQAGQGVDTSQGLTPGAPMGSGRDSGGGANSGKATSGPDSARQQN